MFLSLKNLSVDAVLVQITVTALLGTRSRLNWNLEVVVFEERGKLENQEQTQLTYNAESGNRTQGHTDGSGRGSLCTSPSSARSIN